MNQTYKVTSTIKKKKVMNVLLYNSYNLFFPQYLNTERSTYQLFCNTALRALLHQLKAYYGQKCLCFVLFLVGNNQNGIFFFVLFSRMKQSAGNTQNRVWILSSSLPLHEWTELLTLQKRSITLGNEMLVLHKQQPARSELWLLPLGEVGWVGKSCKPLEKLIEFSVTTAKRDWTEPVHPISGLGVGYFRVNPKTKGSIQFPQGTP